jgi:dTDP-4-dehydrorhamnose reductase
LDIADALIVIAGRAKDDPPGTLRGIFNMTGPVEATWADFAEAVFREAKTRGRRAPRVKRIATATTRRPPSARPTRALDNEKLTRVYGVRPSDWRRSVEACAGMIGGAGRRPGGQMQLKDSCGE